LVHGKQWIHVKKQSYICTHKCEYNFRHFSWSWLFSNNILGGNIAVIRCKGLRTFGPHTKPYLVIQTAVILNLVVRHRRLFSKNKICGKVRIFGLTLRNQTCIYEEVKTRFIRGMLATCRSRMLYTQFLRLKIYGTVIFACFLYERETLPLTVRTRA
jgi:hypothetical protein